MKFDGLHAVAREHHVPIGEPQIEQAPRPVGDRQLGVDVHRFADHAVGAAARVDLRHQESRKSSTTSVAFGTSSPG